MWGVNGLGSLRVLMYIEQTAIIVADCFLRVLGVGHDMLSYDTIEYARGDKEERTDT